MKKIMLNAAIFAAALFMATSCTPNKSENEDSKEVAEDQNEAKFDDTDVEKDSEFAVKAAEGGMLEVELGKLAQQKGMSKEVKDFGKMLVNDHSKANEELKALAQTKNISLPATMSEKCQKTYNDLAEKNGEDFDDAFTEHMVKDHKDDIDAFQKEAEKGEDPDIKQWAAGKISTLEHHLDMAKTAEKAVDDSRKSTGKL
jgi:putative membrane protein